MSKKKRDVYCVDNMEISGNAHGKFLGDKKSGDQLYVFAKMLNCLLEEKGIDQIKMAADLGISAGVISNYRNGKTEPCITKIIKIAEYLDVDCTYLMTGGSPANRTLAADTGLSENAIETLKHINREGNSEEQRTITVKPGWNNIGYTPLVNLPVTTAPSDYFDEATTGDVVKNQHDFAMFTADGKGGGKWQGTLKYMKPGEGYMIHRQKSSTTTFCYPYYEPGDTYIETTMAISTRFASTMTMVAEATGIDVEEGDHLVAYAGGEVVGETTLSPLTSDSSPLFYLSIEGDLEAPLTFAIERGGEIVAMTGELMTYKANDISGSPEEPTKISFDKTKLLPQDGWYTVQGIKLQHAPTKSGVYIYNGKKQIIK